jgi:hypothetical protein
LAFFALVVVFKSIIIIIVVVTLGFAPDGGYVDYAQAAAPVAPAPVCCNM